MLSRQLAVLVKFSTNSLFSESAFDGVVLNLPVTASGN